MKKITLLLILTFVIVLLTGCQDIQAQPKTVAVTAQEPMAKAAPLSSTVETANLGALTENPWQWVSFTDPLEQFEVEGPEKYVLTFNDDGTVNIKADCNNAAGSYTADSGSLKIEVGPMTMAACPPDSRSDEFVGLLGGAARYFFEEGFLYIDLLADGGTMAFAPPAEPASAGDVTSYPWLWTSFTSPVERFKVEAPQNYVVTFNDDGTVNIKADCNNATGSYTVDGGSLKIEIGPMTMAACPPDSRSDQFVGLLGNAARYFFEDAQLYIDLFADGGTMLFAPLGEAEMAEAAAQASSGLPPAEIANDEGGPAFVSGQWNYTSYAVPTHFLEPVVALMDLSRQVQGNYEERVPRTGQIMGTLTGPLAPSPASYRVDVPVLPGGESADLDNDGEEDTGVQLYALVFSTNMVGDSYLEQLEQDGFASVLADPQTGAIREGTLLVYAPDGAQGFPSTAGADGQFFTADDPAVALPAGYTLVTLSSDGEVSFDRAREAKMDTLEPAAAASPDFSDQGILESYNSLIDLLSVRYSYTELRDLDWEEIRQAYLPRVQAADEADDMTAYYLALFDLAMSIRDAHVQVNATDAQMRTAPYVKLGEEFNSNLGAQVVELSDGRFVVTYLDPEGPAAQAGWEFGTEIVTVDGVPMGERLDALPLTSAESTPEGIRTAQLAQALAFPAGTETTIEYRLPGESEPLSATLAAGEGFETVAPSSTPGREEISFKELDGGFGYIQWGAFDDPLYKLAVWEKFLSTFQAAPGIVIDLRDNGGGNLGLLYTMTSFLFSAEEPAPEHWIDSYVYDEQANDLVRAFATDYMLSSPKPELTYPGAIVVLVNENSASAAEYFPQFLQRQGRAIVAGEHGTDGAGGVIERASLPGGITFQFTKGRNVFAGTDEYNLEGKGVTLDVRVPITLENEQAKLEGQDVVLEEALIALGEEADRLTRAKLAGATWQLATVYEASGSQTAIADPENYTITFGEDGTMAIQADCNQASAEYTLGTAGALTITPGPATLAACPEGSLSEEYLQWLGSATSFQIAGKQLVVSTDPESGVLVLVFELVE